MAPGPLHPRWRSLFELNMIEGGPLTSLFPYSHPSTLSTPTLSLPHSLPPRPPHEPVRALSVEGDVSFVRAASVRTLDLSCPCPTPF